MTAAATRVAFPSLQGDDWAVRQAVRISRDLLRNDVYRAMGPGLRTAMIDSDLMTLMALADEVAQPSIARFLALRVALRSYLLPDEYGPADGLKEVAP